MAPTAEDCKAMHDALVSERRLPRWVVPVFSVLLGLVVSLSGLAWRALAEDVKAKASKSEVAHLAEEVTEIKAEVSYLGRKAEADLVNDTVNRRLLNEIASKVGATEAGPLVPVRPAESVQ